MSGRGGAVDLVALHQPQSRVAGFDDDPLFLEVIHRGFEHELGDVGKFAHGQQTHVAGDQKSHSLGNNSNPGLPLRRLVLAIEMTLGTFFGFHLSLPLASRVRAAKEHQQQKTYSFMG